MVSSHHEVLHRFFQEHPEILVPVFEVLKIPLSGVPTVEEVSPDCTEVLERRADHVLRLHPPGDPSFLMVVESQGKKDPVKRFSWAHYLAFLMAKHEEPALLVVTSEDAATAKWAAGPFRLGLAGFESLIVRPVVLGPGNVPIIADVEEAAKSLPMAAFAAVLYRDNPAIGAILEALVRVLGKVDEETAKHYMLTIESGLGRTPAREMWRNLVSTYFPGGGPLLEERERELKAEGEAEALLRVLERRGVMITDDARQRISICTDLDTLDRWLSRVGEVTTAEELFVENEA